MNKVKKLQELAKQIDECFDCKKDTIGKMVFGEGNVDSSIMFVGEAPGKQEAESGRPFIGRSGKLLRSLIQSLGLDDEKDVYITSPVKYLPKKGTPSKTQINHTRPYFLKQLDIIDPKLVVLMGSTAIQSVLGEALPITKNHGLVMTRDGRKYFLTFHPAAALRFPLLRKEIEADFEKLKKIE